MFCFVARSPFKTIIRMWMLCSVKACGLYGMLIPLASPVLFKVDFFDHEFRGRFFRPQKIDFILGQLESISFWKLSDIVLHLFVKALCLLSMYFNDLKIEHNLLPRISYIIDSMVSLVNSTVNNVQNQIFFFDRRSCSSLVSFSNCESNNALYFPFFLNNSS